MIKRKLKNYTFKFENPAMIVYDRRRKTNVVLDQVGRRSLHRFEIRCEIRQRIAEKKQLREAGKNAYNRVIARYQKLWDRFLKTKSELANYKGQKKLF